MGNADVRTVKPADGCLVRYPGSKTQLPASGASVPWTGREGTYWRRREADGSVIIVEEKKEPTQDASETQKFGRRGDK